MESTGKVHFALLQDVQLLQVPEGPAPRRFLGTELMFVREPALVEHLADVVFKSAMSTSHSHATKQCSAHLCVLNQYDQQTMDHDLAMLIAFSVMPVAEVFQQALWLVKDNSVDVGPAYIAVHEPDGHIHHVYQPHSGITSTATCMRSVTTFSEAELDHAFAYFALVHELAPRAVHKDGLPKPSARMHPSRLGRAVFSVQGARYTSDVGMKIVHYCICLESLFSTEREGVTHRIAERAARFLGTTGEEQTIFKNVRELYKIRSSVVHGSALSAQREEEIRGLAIIGDDYLRRTLLRTIRSPELQKRFLTDSDKALDAFFLDQMFPQP